MTLGKKHTCYSCHTKFYDLGKPSVACPKCGANQADAENSPVMTSTRGRRVVEVAPPPIEEDFEEDEAAPATVDEETEIVDVEGAEPEVVADDEEEEY
jgi:uncharacterized protein (TIGR02300 family)